MTRQEAKRLADENETLKELNRMLRRQNTIQAAELETERSMVKVLVRYINELRGYLTAIKNAKTPTPSQLDGILRGMVDSYPADPASERDGIIESAVELRRYLEANCPSLGPGIDKLLQDSPADLFKGIANDGR